MAITYGADRVDSEVQRVLTALLEGQSMQATDAEQQVLDFKEEHGRRRADGSIGPSDPRNESCARELASAASCMANTPGGGALLVGLSDNGEVVGTDVEVEWLRHRIFELTDRRLTVDAKVAEIHGARLLVLRSPQAIEPIRYRGRIRWRVGANCEEIDASTWHAKHMAAIHFDWSAQESNLSASAVRPGALEQAREFLRATREVRDVELAAVPDRELLRRLNVVTNEGRLTNAGVIAFVGREDPCLDYIHRDHAGGDSTARVRRQGRSLLEELAEVFQNLTANTRIAHVRDGLAVGQVGELPFGAAREAVVNGVAHREWGQAEPTVVEHIGRTLRVTSPGGFVPGVSADNIITHPSKSRNRSLTELLAAIRVAEREGVGVDRMVSEMIRLGHEPPDIREISGPYVRAALIGDLLDTAWMRWLAGLRPVQEGQDLNSLLILTEIRSRGWLDSTRAAPLLQLNEAEARGALSKLSQAELAGAPVLIPVAGVPEDAAAAWTLSPRARGTLERLSLEQGSAKRWPSRIAIAKDYASARGRISTTELGSLVGASPTNVGTSLKQLESEGVLEPAWPSRRGKGFYYRLA